MKEKLVSKVRLVLCGCLLSLALYWVLYPSSKGVEQLLALVEAVLLVLEPLELKSRN